MYVLSWITMIYTQYTIYHQHIITNTNYYCNLTQISPQHKIHIFHSILQYNISLHHDIYCDSSLAFTLKNHNFI